MLRIIEFDEPSSSLLIDKNQFEIIESENGFTVPSTILHNTKVSTANSSLDDYHVTSSFMTQISDPSPQTIFKTTFHP